MSISRFQESAGDTSINEAPVPMQAVKYLVSDEIFSKRYAMNAASSAV